MMDVKALAKSKRAHSYHHSKKHDHPHQALKAPLIASDNKKPTGKQAKGKPPQSHVVTNPLPSNWERYNENLDLVQPTEFDVPKSKGADYAHLISEAKDQSRSNYSSGVFPLFDDVMNDFTRDFGPMLLAAKGQSILSWVADDDFEFEGKTSTNVEAPFLSLNLNALAEQLAKAKLSERCFLEPDRFPLEVLDNELQPCDGDRHDPQTCTSAAETDSKAASVSLGYNQEFSKNVQQYPKSSSSSVTVTSNFPVQPSQQGLIPLKQDSVKILGSQGTVRSSSPKSNSQLIIDSTAKNPPLFQAAEAELDMLLSSFTEIKITESTSASSSSSSMEIPSLAAAVSGETVKNRTNMMKPAIDDDIDKLLEETSNLTNMDSRWVSSEVRASPDVISSRLDPSSKSKLLDDFDSWLDTI